jgi:hypothetical protein
VLLTAEEVADVSVPVTAAPHVNGAILVVRPSTNVL